MFLRLNINCKYIEFHHFLTWFDPGKYPPYFQSLSHRYKSFKSLPLSGVALQKACSHTTDDL